MVIDVLVVDDSRSMRRILTDIINSNDILNVVGEASNGKEAIERVEELKPNVIVMDISMPVMDGLTALTHIMRTIPTATIITSAYAQAQEDVTIKAILSGAVDFIPKPDGGTMDLSVLKKNLIYKILVASKVDVNKLRYKKIEEPVAEILDFKQASEGEQKIVVIGASAGGPKSLLQVLRQLPSDFPAGLLIVQHMAAGFTHSFAQHLNSESQIRVKEAKDGDEIQPDLALIAPGNYHMEVAIINKDRTLKMIVKLNKAPPVCHVRPSVDVTMTSAANAFGEKSLGVILTGMGHDGVDGVKAVKKNNGRTFAEDMESSVVNGMPKAAIESGNIDKVLSLSRIPHEIMRFVKEGKK